VVSYSSIFKEGAMKITLTKNLKIVLIVLLASITVFSAIEYLMVLKEKFILTNNLNQARSQITVLTDTVKKERELQAALSQDNLKLKDDLRVNTDKLTQVDLDLRNSRATIEDLTSQVALSKVENTSLRQEKDKLSQDLTQVSQERDTLKARLSSIPELKKAIKEVKVQINLAKAMIREITKQRKAVVEIDGNKGFLVKDGKPTSPTVNIKIEVKPAIPSK
jgi:chromosome segregation ATPase